MDLNSTKRLVKALEDAFIGRGQGTSTSKLNVVTTTESMARNLDKIAMAIAGDFTCCNGQVTCVPLSEAVSQTNDSLDGIASSINNVAEAINNLACAVRASR